MKQNIYDDPGFFTNYQKMRNMEHSLNTAYEIPTMRALLPELQGVKTLDIGCGVGDLCRYAIEQGAASAYGIDISSRMIDEAQRRSTPSERDIIAFECCALEDLTLERNHYDLVVSSLALHYVADFSNICQRVADCLTPGGYFVFSMEHPVMTANKTDWLFDAQGNLKYNIVMDYFKEGQRRAEWLGAEVVSYHNRFSTLINNLVKVGFMIEQVEEEGFLFIRAALR